MTDANHDEIEDARLEAYIESAEDWEDQCEERRAEHEGCLCWQEPGAIACPIHSPRHDH